MSDWKRFAVWIGVIAWCFFSLAFDVRAQGTIDLSPLPEFTEQRCSEPVDVAANTIIIKKKAVASAPAGVGGCNPGIGSNATTGTIEPENEAGLAFAYRAQAQCSGTLSDAFVYNGAATNVTAKMCIYNSPNATMNTTDTLVACSAEITGNSATTWYSGAFASGSITTGNYYWVLIVLGGASDWSYYHDTSATIYYNTGWTDNYASPPATLGADWLSAESYAPVRMYVTME